MAPKIKKNQTKKSKIKFNKKIRKRKIIRFFQTKANHSLIRMKEKPQEKPWVYLKITSNISVIENLRNPRRFFLSKNKIK